MMSARAYAIRLALLLLIFVIVIPGGVAGLLYAMEHSSGARGAALGFGYVAYFIGIPLWVLGFGIALWLTARARVQTVGLPNWVSLSLVVLVLADWRFFLWMFRPFVAPFLWGAILLLVALLFWPDRAAPGRDQRQPPGYGYVAAVWAWGFFALLACASLAAS